MPRKPKLSEFFPSHVDPGFPKTLLIRNSPGGMVWQVYHVHSQAQADFLRKNATANAFLGITLEEYQPEIEETWPDWRETCSSALKALL